MAVTKYMIDRGWHDEEFINENVNFFEDFKESLEEYTLEYAEEVTGISKETLIQMAEMIRDADGTCILWGMGVTQNTGGSDTSRNFKLTSCNRELSSSRSRCIPTSRSQ